MGAAIKGFFIVLGWLLLVTFGQIGQWVLSLFEKRKAEEEEKEV